MANTMQIVQLARDVYRNTVPAAYADQNPEAKLREEFIKLNGGSTKLNVKTMRDNPQLFTILETIISLEVEDGLRGDEFFMDMVDYVDTSTGDRNEFIVPDKTTFITAEIANGILTPRRQRIAHSRTVSIPTSIKAIRVFEEFSRVLAGRVDWNDFLDSVVRSVMQRRYNDIFTAFSGIDATTVGMSSDFVLTGTYDEAKTLELIEKVEAAAGGKVAKVVGTKSALRKLPNTANANSAKESYYNVGHYGKLAGTDLLSVTNRFKAGTTQFIIPDNKLYVIASDDKPIKFVTEGEPIISDKAAADNADLTQEYTYLETTGVGVLAAGKVGVITLA